MTEHNRTWKNNDWPKEFEYYTVIQEALRTGQVPYHVSKKYHKYTTRFLGLAETCLSPQVLLLGMPDLHLFGHTVTIKVGKFIVFNVCLLYTIGFLGCLALRRRYGLGLLPFTVLFLLFNFSGHITSHMAVGHSMWIGYFLLPFFCLYVLQLVEGEHAWLTGLKLALVLFVMELQGSFHMVDWCWMFLLLLTLAGRRYCLPVAVAVVGSGMLAFFRLFPMAYTFWGFKDPEYSFLSGYSTLKDLLDAFIVIREDTYPWTGGIFGHLGWWEYDVYTGVLGLGLLVYFGVWKRFDRGPALAAYQYPDLDLPLALMAILSLSYFFAPVSLLPLPLFNGERVSSRFLIIPLVMLMVISAIRGQRWLEHARLTPRHWLFVLAGLAQLAFALLTHSATWCIEEMELHWPQIWYGEKDPVITITIEHQDDPTYVAVVWASAAYSLFALAVWLALFWRAKNRQRAMREVP